MLSSVFIGAVSGCLILFTPSVPAEQAQERAISEEKEVPPYALPDLLVTSRGKKVTTAEDWMRLRRPEILDLFSSHVYGRVPRGNVRTEFIPGRSDPAALCGKAVRKEIFVRSTIGSLENLMTLLIYLPAISKGPVPVFLGLNFEGNHTICPDPGISVTRSWVPNNVQACVLDHSATPLSRGAAAPSWPVERIIERGYGLATIYYGDIDPDFDDGFKNGIQPLFYAKGQTEPAADEWGSIAAWAWGLSRAMDYLQTDPRVDAKKVIVLGHSRLGKTALWAGATDSRFAIVISNNSGCGGAALSRRIFGETVGMINDRFPHWFCRNFRQYNRHEQSLPLDQHMLLALIAPRPVYVASAEQDSWADPKGEYLSSYHAGAVYRLFGKAALDSESMPPVNQPLIHQDVGYHIRAGAHALSRYDWERYMDFADWHFRRRA